MKSGGPTSISQHNPRSFTATTGQKVWCHRGMRRGPLWFLEVVIKREIFCQSTLVFKSRKMITPMFANKFGVNYRSSDVDSLPACYPSIKRWNPSSSFLRTTRLRQMVRIQHQ